MVADKKITTTDSILWKWIETRVLDQNGMLDKHWLASGGCLGPMYRYLLVFASPLGIISLDLFLHKVFFN